jgi:hypothetical protein
VWLGPAVWSKAELDVQLLFKRNHNHKLSAPTATTYTTMNFRDLPPEMQSRILEVCSPSALAVLSRVDTLGRDMAEYALYSRIQYCVRPSDLIIGSWQELELKEDGSLLHTLVNNSRKALMVKIFLVELLDEYDEEDAFHQACSMKANFILVKLAEALVKTSNLVDLRILHGQWMNDFDDSINVFKGTRRICEVIRFVFTSGGIDGG